MPLSLKDKYIQFKVVPVSEKVPNTGEVATSSVVGPIVLLPTAPVALDVRISGNAIVGETLTGEYTYYDVNGDEESGTTYRWLYAKSPSGKYKTISGAYGKTYTITESDQGRYIKFEVGVRSAVSPKNGDVVVTEPTGSVGLPVIP